MDVLPDGLLIGYYGDDHTGASAVLEVLSFAGLPTVLFLVPPDDDDIAAFAGYRAIGIAGTSRARDTDWMRENLPPIFHRLAGLGAPITHYKVCSTLDSAPEIGSIGCAVDLAVPILGGTWHPLLVAAPSIGRCQAFGNLFAAADGKWYRLDRHPTMARHPVTPIQEADIRLHLARQTERRIGLINLLDLNEGHAQIQLEALCDRGENFIAIDALDDATLAAAGAMIWRNRGRRIFAVGSQGVEYALVSHWLAAGLIPRVPPVPTPTPVARIAAVSASCAEATAAQIAYAEQGGFTTVAIDAARAVDSEAWERELDHAASAVATALAEGRSAIGFTARGPGDPAIGRMTAALSASGESSATVNARIGAGLGRLLDRVMREAGIDRGAVVGGDTSGHAAEAMGIRALTASAPIVPGAPLCNVHGGPSAAAEIVFKGGQMGGPDFFERVRTGGPARRDQP